MKRSAIQRLSLALVVLVFAAGLGIGISCQGDEGRPVYPSFPKTILELAANEPDLTTWVDLVKVSGLDTALKGNEASLTAFAPSNAAFAAFPADQLATLRMSPMQLSAFLRYSIVPGTQKVNLLQFQTNLRTITSTVIRLSYDSATKTITLNNRFGGSARITKGDLLASNGVLHVIDGVLTPPPVPMDGGVGDGGPPDAGPRDAAPAETGLADAPPGDAPPGDAPPGDALSGDAPPADAGPGDAGPGDAGPGDTNGPERL